MHLKTVCHANTRTVNQVSKSDACTNDLADRKTVQRGHGISGGIQTLLRW